jgi:hypothetical protein
MIYGVSPIFWGETFLIDPMDHHNSHVTSPDFYGHTPFFTTFSSRFFSQSHCWSSVAGAHVTGLNIDHTQLKMARELLKSAVGGTCHGTIADS